MRELFDAELRVQRYPRSGQAGCGHAGQDVLVPTVTDKLTKDILSKAGDRLKLIASFGTGVDHIDLVAAKARGITVTNTPGVLSEDTADVGDGAGPVCAAPAGRRRPAGRLGNWTGWSPPGCSATALMASVWALSVWGKLLRLSHGVLGFWYVCALS